MRFFPIKPETTTSQDEFNQLLRTFWGEVAQPVPGYAPRLDVREDADAVVVKVDLPGVDRKDISLALEQGVLTLRGQRHAEHSESDEKRGWHRVERHWGSFERQLRLGEGYAADRVKAELKDGVLTVVVPKQEQAKPRSIEIQ
jgi:HSP20 family protein